MRGCYQMFTLAVIAAVLRGCPCFELGPSFWPRSFSDIRCAGWHSGHIWFGLGRGGSWHSRHLVGPPAGMFSAGAMACAISLASLALARDLMP